MLREKLLRDGKKLADFEFYMAATGFEARDRKRCHEGQSLKDCPGIVVGSVTWADLGVRGEADLAAQRSFVRVGHGQWIEVAGPSQFIEDLGATA